MSEKIHIKILVSEKEFEHYNSRKPDDIGQLRTYADRVVGFISDAVNAEDSRMWGGIWIEDVDTITALQRKLKEAKADTRLWKLRTDEAADVVAEFEELEAENKRLNTIIHNRAEDREVADKYDKLEAERDRLKTKIVRAYRFLFMKMRGPFEKYVTELAEEVGVCQECFGRGSELDQGDECSDEWRDCKTCDSKGWKGK